MSSIFNWHPRCTPNTKDHCATFQKETKDNITVPIIATPSPTAVPPLAKTPPASASRGDSVHAPSPQWKPTKRVKKQEKKERRKRKRELKKEWAMYSAPAPETCASRSASAKTWAVSGGMSEDVVKKRKDVCADEGHGLRNCGTQPPSPEHFKEVVVEREQAERIGRAEGSPERATRAYTTPQFNKVANVAAIKHAGSSLLPACTNRRASALFKKRNLAFFAMWIDPTYGIPKRRATRKPSPRKVGLDEPKIMEVF
ncbi:hypothetical protein DFH09DRAFT_1096932 [Mycena vulgaris]|nr:hypothetical protein DFH09DRAFT_1096932 [Mycena vulgaris]